MSPTIILEMPRMFTSVGLKSGFGFRLVKYPSFTVVLFFGHNLLWNRPVPLQVETDSPNRYQQYPEIDTP